MILLRCRYFVHLVFQGFSIHIILFQEAGVVVLTNAVVPDTSGNCNFIFIHQVALALPHTAEVSHCSLESLKII